ncbi:MAG: serine/threonine-protein kinase [Kiritimatiellae bacterium]|nr:serine/threonine-protein kinase [Kiritimatiellia bacterium]
MNTKAIEQHGFQLVEQINETSRTIAWKSVQTTLDRTVILRILKPEAAADPAIREHFLKIARRIARIKCDGLAAVFDIVSDDDLHYVVMEHVDGPTIEELVAHQGPLPFEQMLKIALSVARTIEQMWSSERIVHRNLKSSTIRLDARGIAKITDFSLSILTDEGPEAYAMDEGHIVGTPCFLSPEQVQGSLDLSTLSDMYALGAVCYHMATAKVPFEGQEVVAILNAHLHEQLQPPHMLNPKVPATFSWFVRRLMIKNPELRYRTWDDVIKDILRQTEGQTPLCVCPYDTSVSTVMNFTDTGGSGGEAGQSGPRIRLRRKRQLQELTAYQSKTLADDHAQDIRRATRSKEGVLWLALVLWLLLVFWYRAAYETASAETSDTSATVTESPVSDSPPLAGNGEDIRIFAESAEQGFATDTDKPSLETNDAKVTTAATAPDATVSPSAETLPPLSPELATALAETLSRGDVRNARAILQADTTAFQQQEEFLTFLEQMPDPDSLVADYLKSQIGKPLVLEHNGAQRTVIPRGVENGIIHLEAGGRGVEMPISRLSPDTKLRWMEMPADPPSLAAYCLTLMRTERRDEVHGLAIKCPPLTGLLIEAARLANSN